MTSAGPQPGGARPPLADLAPIPQAVLAAGTAVIAWTVDFWLGVMLLFVLVGLSPPRVGWRPVRASRVLLCYAPFVVLWLAIAIGYLQLMHWLGHPVAPQATLRQLAGGDPSAAQLGLVLFAVVIVAPLWEELLFRGYLYTAFRSRSSFLLSQLGTALLFGLAHGVAYAFPIGVLALLFGWLRHRYDALLPAILAHAIHNGLTVAVAIAWPETLDWMYPA
ncbi:MAG: CPBP family intramembrane metalloprotease [bacterium]|nr:CPBP family intramembrane metalloprotease [bacterium]